MVREHAEYITSASGILQTIESFCRPVTTSVNPLNHDLSMKDPIFAWIVNFGTTGHAKSSMPGPALDIPEIAQPALHAK